MWTDLLQCLGRGKTWRPWLIQISNVSSENAWWRLCPITFLELGDISMYNECKSVCAVSSFPITALRRETNTQGKRALKQYPWGTIALLFSKGHSFFLILQTNGPSMWLFSFPVCTKLAQTLKSPPLTRGA